MQPNRLERVWQYIRPEILARYTALTCEDLEICEHQYDRIIETIRKTYNPGRSHLTIEGELRDWLNERIAYFERKTYEEHK